MKEKNVPCLAGAGFTGGTAEQKVAFARLWAYNKINTKKGEKDTMSSISREKALENALASSRMEGYAVTEQTRRDCLRLLNGEVDAQTLAKEILARCKAEQRG